MAQMKSTDWLQYIWKILGVATFLVFLGLILPACFSDLDPLSDTYI